MNHLTIPEDAKHIRLPYLATDEYDGGELTEYPNRMKWTQKELIKSHRSQEQVNAFFQTWLFFGCLITIFRCVGISVKVKDFVHKADDGRQYLTTAELPRFLEKWRSLKRKGGDWVKKEHLDTALLPSDLRRGKPPLSPVGYALEDHRQLMEQYCGPESPVSPEVAVTIVSVYWTLYNWHRGISYSDWDSSTFRIPTYAIAFFQAKMETKGWCPAEAAGLISELEFDGLYYVSCLPTPRYENDHSQCDVEHHSCGYKGSTFKYETQHAQPGCQCDFIKMPSDTVDIIRSGGIPILSFVQGQLRATKYEARKTRYVAISHVWSDGMGNENNALPRCQLERLQSLTDKVDHYRQIEPPPLPAKEMMALAFEPSDSNSDSEEPDADADTELAGFWLDTLCVPVAPDEVRNDQISKMRFIYRDASVVLVIDRWLQELALSADVSHKFIRLRLSNWQHRLWTCQEGVFARSLYFQFADGPMRLFDLTEEAGLRKRDGPQKSTIPASSQDIPAFAQGKLEKFEICHRVLPILLAVRSRMTTKKKDETVCIATLLGLDPGKLLRIIRTENDGTSSQDVCDRRMEALIVLIDQPPQGLIFHRMERLTTPGYRWAPRSFLGQRLADPLLPSTPPSNRSIDLAGEPGLFVPGQGLLVHFPAYLLDIRGAQTALTVIISNGKQHFRVRLQSDEPSLHSIVASCSSNPAPPHKIKDRRYAVRDEHQFVLVTNYRGGPQAVLCAMDTIIGKPEFMMSVHKLRYICPAAVQKMKLGRKDNKVISFTFQKEWDWIIS